MASHVIDRACCQRPVWSGALFRLGGDYRDEVGVGVNNPGMMSPVGDLRWRTAGQPGL